MEGICPDGSGSVRGLGSGGLTMRPMGHLPGAPGLRGPRAETYFFIDNACCRNGPVCGVLQRNRQHDIFQSSHVGFGRCLVVTCSRREGVI